MTEDDVYAAIDTFHGQGMRDALEDFLDRKATLAQPVPAAATTNLLTLIGEYADRGSSDVDGDFRYSLPAELRIAYKAHLAALPL